MFKQDRPRKTYPSDLTDEQWAIMEPLLPPPRSGPRGGRPRQVELRAGLGHITVDTCGNLQSHIFLIA